MNVLSDLAETEGHGSDLGLDGEALDLGSWKADLLLLDAIEPRIKIDEDLDELDRRFETVVRRPMAPGLIDAVGRRGERYE